MHAFPPAKNHLKWPRGISTGKHPPTGCVALGAFGTWMQSAQDAWPWHVAHRPALQHAAGQWPQYALAIVAITKTSASELNATQATVWVGPSGPDTLRKPHGTPKPACGALLPCVRSHGPAWRRQPPTCTRDSPCAHRQQGYQH